FSGLLGPNRPALGALAEPAAAPGSRNVVVGLSGPGSLIPNEPSWTVLYSAMVWKLSSYSIFQYEVFALNDAMFTPWSRAFLTAASSPPDQYSSWPPMTSTLCVRS